MQSHSTKTCKICHTAKPLEDFYLVKNANGRSYRHSYCKKCIASERRKWHFTPAGQRAHRGNMLRTKYGTTHEEYDELLKKHNGVCAICKKPETRKNRAGGIRLLAIDHDHTTGKIRGLLCQSCNSGIGYFGDDPELIRAAAMYLERHHAG